LKNSRAVVYVNCTAVYEEVALFVRCKAFKTCGLYTTCSSLYKNVFVYTNPRNCIWNV